MQYAITATVSRETADGYTSNRQLPTFILDSSIQGITDIERARVIAATLLQDAAGDDAEINFHVAEMVAA